VRLQAGLLLLLLLGMPAATAFRSFPPGSSVHDGITKDAAAPLGFPGKAAAALAQATRRPDYDEMKISLNGNGSLRMGVTSQYLPFHHCDRLPGISDADAFKDTALYVAQQREVALADLRNGQAQDAGWAIGRALHALQDCFAHSDIVRGGFDAEQYYERAVTTGGDPLPGLHVTGFDPTARDTASPPGDPYPYSRFNLDANTDSPMATTLLPDGNTCFEHARQDAIAASRMYLQSILDNLTGPQRDALMGLHETTPPPKLPVPAPAVAVPVLVGLAALARRRRSA